MSTGPLWSPFYQELGVTAPKLLQDVDPELKEWIIWDARESDNFYSDWLQSELEAHWHNPERAVRRVLEVWLHNVKHHFQELLGPNSLYPLLTDTDKARLLRALDRIHVQLTGDHFIDLVAAAMYGMTSQWRPISIVLQGLLESTGTSADGQIVRAVAIPWRVVASEITRDWNAAFQIGPRKWEELIAAAFDQEGYDEVTLTPRSGDYGRDVIAVKKGIGTVRIIGSVKAYAPGHPVTQDDVRALMGVLQADHKASKGIVTTTSTFAPNMGKDPYISQLIPYRLELLDGSDLRNWLVKLCNQ